MKLKSRTVFPPGGGFHLLLPELGMQRPVIGSFREVVAAFLQLQNQNKALAQKLGWPSDVAGAEAWVEQRECQRLIAQGWTTFVDLGGPSPTIAPAPQLKKKGVSVVGAAKRAKAAFAAYSAMVGPSGPVSRDVALRRAQVCAVCPQNDTASSFKNYFLESAAEEIMVLIGAFKSMDLTTPVDDKLGVCKSCLCPMRAKVHAPLDAVVSKLPPEVWPELSRNPLCWILSESGRP